MWLRAKAAKAAWERILLDEFFLFSGGLEGAWSCADGWTEDAGGTEELPVPAGGRRHPIEGDTSEKQKQHSAEREDGRTGVLLEDSQVSMRRGSSVDSNVRALRNGQSSAMLCFVYCGASCRNTALYRKSS